MTMTVKAEERVTKTQGELRKLRERGLVPASVSGKKITPVSLAVDEKELLMLLRGHSHELLEMDIPQQGRQTVMLKEVQRDKRVSGKLLHVEFHQISMDEPVKTMVPIDLVGEPSGVGEGGLLQQMLDEVEVRALPKLLPSAIYADVSGLSIGDKLTVGELQIPTEVECLSDPAIPVATVLHVRKLTEEEEIEMSAEAEGKGGLKEYSGAKLSDRPTADEAREERS